MSPLAASCCPRLSSAASCSGSSSGAGAAEAGSSAGGGAAGVATGAGAGATGGGGGAAADVGGAGTDADGSAIANCWGASLASCATIGGSCALMADGVNRDANERVVSACSLAPVELGTDSLPIASIATIAATE